MPLVPVKKTKVSSGQEQEEYSYLGDFLEYSAYWVKQVDNFNLKKIIVPIVLFCLRIAILTNNSEYKINQ